MASKRISKALFFFFSFFPHGKRLFDHKIGGNRGNENHLRTLKVTYPIPCQGMMLMIKYLGSIVQIPVTLRAILTVGVAIDEASLVGLVEGRNQNKLRDVIWARDPFT